MVEREAKMSMKAGGALGRIGPRGGYIREPSAPGTPPHVQLGALRASITHATTHRGETNAPVEIVGPTAKYGAVHEFGSRTHPKRPFMRPALQRIAPQIKRLFARMKLK